MPDVLTSSKPDVGRCASRCVYYCHIALYRMIFDVPGVIMEFGVHRGRRLALLAALRGGYEPYNPHRRIIGFDTFTGFPQRSEIDTTSPATPSASSRSRRLPKPPP